MFVIHPRRSPASRPSCTTLAALVVLACSASAIGSETLVVEPSTVALSGPHDFLQLAVTIRADDGRERDVTRESLYRIEGEGRAKLGEKGLVQPEAEGEATLIVEAGGLSARVPLTVSGLSRPRPVSFRRELVAVLNTAGCNAGACHGTPSGKNGFKLSLRGFDPAADYLQLTHDVSGRRTNSFDPDGSLLLLKAQGQVPHEGGQRLVPGSLKSSLVREWIAGGLGDDPADLPALTALEARPGPRILHAPSKARQLAVVARFADGSSRDVTRLTSFSTSDEHVAKVDADGLVEFQKAGEVAVLGRYLQQMVSVRVTHLDPKAGYEWPETPEVNYVDKHVFDKLKLLSIAPSGLSTDQEFLRRAYLDLAGILPTPVEAKAFLADDAPDKRARLVDSLLQRPEFADFWALKWADLLGTNRRAIQAKGAYTLHQWLRERFAENTPFDEVARDIVTGDGSTFTSPTANYYRNDRVAKDPKLVAQGTAQVFFGIRMSCAQCHNHPYERWTQDEYHGFAAFFARVKSREDPLNPYINRFNQGAMVIYGDRSGEAIHPRTKKVVPPKFLGGSVAETPEGTDRREVLARWLTGPENPYFARATVNRVWYHLVGRGIVDPVDDFRDSNPPASDELLAALAADFVAHGYDLRHLIRTIANSRVYQLSAATNAFNADDERYFSHAAVKLLPAEPLLDAVSSATGVAESFAESPAGTRAVQLPDGDVLKHPFLSAFGQPARETSCECERQGDASLGQALQLINGPTLKRKLGDPNNRIGTLLARGAYDKEVLDDLYLATLSRFPTESETRAVFAHLSGAADRRKAWEDVQWSLINAKEFLFRH